MQWTYLGEELTEVPLGYYGFVYLLTTECGKKYIGMKSFYKETTVPVLKNGKNRENSTRIGKNIKGKRVYFDVVKKESKWKTYESSSKQIKNYKIASKTVLYLAISKRELTYMEVKHLFISSAIEGQDFLNSNIAGRWFRGNIV